jgi:hypothetical protein
MEVESSCSVCKQKINQPFDVQTCYTFRHNLFPQETFPDKCKAKTPSGVLPPVRTKARPLTSRQAPKARQRN